MLEERDVKVPDNIAKKGKFIPKLDEAIAR
jgi:hypothetical protein